MSNNVQITAGSGTIIETIDEGGGVERQVITLGSIGDSSDETQLSAGQKTSANSIPVVVASDQSSVATSFARVSPAGGTASTITTGGTAVTVVTGPVNGGYIVNPANAASQAISGAENVYIDPVETPGSTDSAANGTTVLLQPGQNFLIPPLASGSVIKANAATSGHKLTVVVW